MHMHDTVKLCAYLDIFNSHDAGPSLWRAAKRAQSCFQTGSISRLRKSSNEHVHELPKDNLGGFLDCKLTPKYSLNAVLNLKCLCSQESSTLSSFCFVLEKAAIRLSENTRELC